jgi:hypothetical protein
VSSFMMGADIFFWSCSAFVTRFARAYGNYSKLRVLAYYNTKICISVRDISQVKNGHNSLKSSDLNVIMICESSYDNKQAIYKQQHIMYTAFK